MEYYDGVRQQSKRCKCKRVNIVTCCCRQHLIHDTSILTTIHPPARRQYISHHCAQVPFSSPSRRRQPSMNVRSISRQQTSSNHHQIVEWAFGKRMTPAERLRKHQRALEKTQRELDRERTKLEQQEKKLVQEIKRNAKSGQMGAVKVQAKDLVRTRRLVVQEHRPPC